MMEHIMPDIPRIYTAVAEWMACMLFIYPAGQKEISKTADGRHYGSCASDTECVFSHDG